MGTWADHRRESQRQTSNLRPSPFGKVLRPYDVNGAWRRQQDHSCIHISPCGMEKEIICHGGPFTLTLRSDCTAGIRRNVNTGFCTLGATHKLNHQCVEWGGVYTLSITYHHTITKRCESASRMQRVLSSVALSIRLWSIYEGVV
jgi:hypothetical protein